jgi:copper transport protein
VAWRATSADGHPVRGAFTFSVGASQPADRAGLLALIPEENAVGWEIAAAITRWLLFAGALIAAGGVAFLLLVHDRRESEHRVLVRVVQIAALVAAVATVLGVAWQAPITSGQGGRALVNGEVLRSVLFSSFGLSGIVRVLGLAAVAIAVARVWSRPAVWVAAAGAVLALLSFVLTGHTAASSPRWLVSLTNFTHVVAAATWFGGLLLLLLTLRRRRGEGDAVGAARLVARFSTVATFAIIAVLVGGTGLAYSEVRAPRALISTAYGWTLVAKLSLVGLVLLGGLYNNRRLVPAIKARTLDAWGRLRQIMRLEASGMVAVLAVTAVLVNLVPAKTAAGITGFYSANAPMGQYTLNVTVDPNRAGHNEVHIYLLAANGQPTDPGGQPQEMVVRFNLPANDIGPIERRASIAGPGHWTLAGTEMSIPGQWVVDFMLPVSRFEQLNTKMTVPVNG